MCQPTDRYRFLGLATLLAAIVAVSVWYGFTQGRPTAVPRQVDLFVPAHALNVGEVWSQRDLRWVLPIHNRAPYSIHVADVTGSCHCSESEPKDIIIPAQEMRPITLVVNLATKSVTDSLSSRYPFSFEIMVHVDRPVVETIQFRCTGTVRNAIRLSQPVVYFDEASNILSPQHEFAPKEVQFESAVPLKSVDLVPGRSDVIWSVTMDTDRSGTISLRPDGHVAPGAFRIDIDIVGVTVDAQRLPVTPFAVEGVAIEDIHALPQEVILGAVEVGEQLETTVTIKSRTGKRFSIESVRFDKQESDVILLVGDLATNEAVYQIRQQITGEGVNNSAVTFHVRTTENAASDVIVPVKYIGFQGEVRK